MITSLIEMIELPNFGHMTTTTNNLSHVMKSRVANFADIIKNSTMFTKTNFEASKNF